MSERFYGKYRGAVVNNLDPLQLGRVQVSCPQVLGLNVLSWAMPNVPYAGPFVGFYMIPPVGANVWVEFEAGDRSKPIWAGCFWGTGQVPALPAIPTTHIIKTLGLTIKLDDLPGAGGVTIEAMPPVVGVPVTVKLDVTGASISCGAASVAVNPVSVSLNNGALEVI